MTTSDAINELATALAKAQGEMTGAVKDAANPFFRSKYADLASVWDACRGPLARQGLSVVQFPNTEFRGEPTSYEWTAKQSGETRYGVRVTCIVSVRTRLLHASGQWLEDVVSTMLPTGDPQAVGSAISYLRRYSLQSVVGVAPEDDDGEAATASHSIPQAPRVTASGAEKASQTAPAASGATTVKRVDVTTGKTGSTPWTRYKVLFEDGRDGTTFDKKLGEQLRTEKGLVTPYIERGPKGNDLVGLMPPSLEEPVIQLRGDIEEPGAEG